MFDTAIDQNESYRAQSPISYASSDIAQKMQRGEEVQLNLALPTDLSFAFQKRGGSGLRI